jgi:hypothetical protein
MANVVFKVNIHIDEPELSEVDLREEVEASLNTLCSRLETHIRPLYINCKIREVLDLD